MAKLNPVLFLRQVRQEVSKVVWPTRREAMMSTLMVILFTVCAAVFFFVVDQILAYALKLILGLGG
jgi:preprotein translocase subunit SecE